MFLLVSYDFIYNNHPKLVFKSRRTMTYASNNVTGNSNVPPRGATSMFDREGVKVKHVCCCLPTEPSYRLWAQINHYLYSPTYNIHRNNIHEQFIASTAQTYTD